MLIPSKHERLEKNLLVIGADVLSQLKKAPCNIESLFQKLKKTKFINLNQYYNVITFLWLAEFINVDANSISIKINDALK